MGSFSLKISPFVDAEIALANAAMKEDNSTQQFAHLERAHVLGQSSTYHHVRIHILMMVWGFQQKSPKEVAGQVMRIVGAATKTALGWIPSGNTGGSNISPFKSLPIPSDLQAILLHTSK